MCVFHDRNNSMKKLTVGWYISRILREISVTRCYFIWSQNIEPSSLFAPSIACLCWLKAAFSYCNNRRIFSFPASITSDAQDDHEAFCMQSELLSHWDWFCIGYFPRSNAFIYLQQVPRSVFNFFFSDMGPEFPVVYRSTSGSWFYPCSFSVVPHLEHLKGNNGIQGKLPTNPLSPSIPPFTIHPTSHPAFL